MSEPTIKPIQTHYKGYHFRSRLEARWAVFFDVLGLTWTYEPEGYDMDGVWYLPDFWIEDWKCFVEIKGKEPTEEEIEKCKRLTEITEERCLLIRGNPWPREHEIHYADLFFCDDEILLVGDDNMFFCNCDGCEGAFLFTAGFNGSMIQEGLCGCMDGDPDPWNGVRGRLLNAFEAARSHRFDT